MYEVSKLEINRNPYIGLYLTASDDALLCSKYVPEKVVQKAASVLKVKKICITSIGDSYLTGLFTVINSHCVLVPEFTEDAEIETIETKLGLKVCKIDNRFSAIRNNFLINDKNCILNENMPKSEWKKIEKYTGVEVNAARIGTIPTIGSINVLTNKGLLCYNNASEKDSAWLSRVLKVNIVKGTCNFGTISTGLGIVANLHGALAGSHSTGFELGNIFEALSGDNE